MSEWTLNRALTSFLLVVFVVSLLATGYVAMNPPRSTDPYTEFYLLGPAGNASDYPTQLTPGESGTVTVGVTNHEGESTAYLIRVVDTNATGDGTLVTRSRTIPAGETWKTNVTFSMDSPGRHLVRFQLYKGGMSTDPYRTTRLWINVTATQPAMAQAVDATERSTNEEVL